MIVPSRAPAAAAANCSNAEKVTVVAAKAADARPRPLIADAVQSLPQQNLQLPLRIADAIVAASMVAVIPAAAEDSLANDVIVIAAHAAVVVAAAIALDGQRPQPLVAMMDAVAVAAADAHHDAAAAVAAAGCFRDHADVTTDAADVTTDAADVTTVVVEVVVDADSSRDMVIVNPAVAAVMTA